METPTPNFENFKIYSDRSPIHLNHPIGDLMEQWMEEQAEEIKKELQEECDYEVMQARGA